MMSLLQAIAIILVVSFISLGVRPGLIIALSIPLTLAIVFPIMKLAGIDMQRILARARSLSRLALSSMMQ